MSEWQSARIQATQLVDDEKKNGFYIVTGIALRNAISAAIKAKD